MSSPIILVDRDFAMSILSSDGVKDFWREIGFNAGLPDHCITASDGECVGVFEIVGTIDQKIFGLHIAIPPALRRHKSQFGRQLIDFAFYDLGASKVVARIQIDRPEVLLYARRSGMLEYSRDENHIYMRAIKCR